MFFEKHLPFHLTSHFSLLTLMALHIKDKLRLGLLFLFGLVLLLAVLGIGFVYRLQRDSGAILTDNHRSLVYVREMQQVVDGLAEGRRVNTEPLVENLRLEEANLTEVGEGDAVRQVRQEWEAFRRDSALARLPVVRQALYRIQDLNMQAIVRKNDAAVRSAETATLIIGILGTLCVLIAFSFALNFPSYIAEPLRQLTEGIRAVAARNYQARMRVNAKDEFGEVAAAFNGMVDKLDEYENSNLAKILFEKRRIETIIANLRDAVVGLDETKKVLFANSVALKLLNLKEAELVGKYAPDVALKNDLFRTLLNGQTDGKELNIYADDRESFFVREAFDVEAEEEAPLRLPDGGREGIQQLVVPKKTRIGQVILLKNVTEYHDLDAAKTAFIATVSHELKTPLASANIGLKLLEKDVAPTLNPEQRAIIADLQQDNQRLIRLVSELLDLAQLETGRLNLTIGTVMAHDLIEYATATTKQALGEKRLTLRVDVAHDARAFRADHEKAAWVLTNLLTNAIKYSDEGGEIAVTARNGPSDTVLLSVRDHGPGIPPDLQEKIFQPYFKTATRSGTGLGLSISREFMVTMQGRVRLESAVGQGSTFTLEFPAA